MLFAIAVHIILAQPPTPLVSPTALNCAVKEVARIWARYDILIEVHSDPLMPIPPEATLITVQSASVVAASKIARRAVGLIDVDASGLPMPTVAINYVGLIELVGGLSFLGKREWQWARALRDQIVGRALGRVLAHELGHFLLVRRTHSISGLMRANHRIAELTDVVDDAYRLEPADRDRLATTGTRIALERAAR